MTSMNKRKIIMECARTSRVRTASAALALSVLCLTGASACTSGPAPVAPVATPYAAASTAHAEKSVSPTQHVEESVSPAQRAAERVKSRVDPMIAQHLTTYGEGTKSPCRPSAKTLFDKKCLAAATSIGSIAEAALAEIEGVDKPGFATLRQASAHTMEAVRGYTELGCAGNPTDPSTRSKCVDHGSVIAQSPTDLMDGLRLGLTGQ
ncbi:hypothetical protein [Streptomyces litmocidini]|uniref:Lipoprotein n=1 Tax=Streptomyces litmocidini TaxID=67318 RepID=A0ABW7UJ54_9ACTN